MIDLNKPVNFIQNIIDSDLASGRVVEVVTRFPPEPNGYLHIGHAKSICLNFDLAEANGGRCNLRFDDTNPETESPEYVNAIIEDVRWLGYDWSGNVRYASDYFDQLFEWAQFLIKQGKAYVCELTSSQTREYRGTLTLGGRDSPFRYRPASESLELLEQMRSGRVEEGKMTLRARIDMQSPNINLRDPVLYRIKKYPHHRTGRVWSIYPSYDFAHGQEDALEGITHSICTLEFADNRALYDWFIENLPVPATPKQFEFGRLNINYMVTSKRKLKQLVDDNIVDGWDDPRMPTLSGMRRRGITARAIKNFCKSLAVAKTDGVVDIAQFEHFIRDDLNKHAKRGMCVLEPLKLLITNYSGDCVEDLSIPYHPNRSDLGYRTVPFTAAIWIERNDFSENRALSRKKFKRLVLGDYVRLRGAYIVRADSVTKDVNGIVTEIRASLVPGTVGKSAPEDIKPRGVIHWVSEQYSVDCCVHQYDRLFSHPLPESGDESFAKFINLNSLKVINGCKAEPELAKAQMGENYQFERIGYFCLDSRLKNDDDLVFNCTIGLRDTWSKTQ